MNRPRGTPRRPAPPALMEEIEPRILFAADLAAFALPPAPGQDSAEVRLLQTGAHEEDNLAALLQSIPVDSRPAAQIQPQASQATAPATEWVVIDPLVPERDRLMADLQAQAQAQGRHFEIVVLDAQRDGLAQITELLAAHPEVAALHIVSHGSEGALHLGSTQVDSEALAAHASELSQWSRALGADADILLYGCSVAAGADGQDFIARLAALTGADVAASTDLTGNAAAGGNWTLEYQSGQVEASSLVDQQVPSWDGVLAITSNGTSSSASSANTTSLTWAHTVASGSNRVLFVELAIDGLGAPVSGVTYDGVAMTQVGRTPGNHAVEIWSLVNPSVGTANVVVNFGGNTAVTAGATTFNGVDQTSPTGTYVGATGIGMVSSVVASSAIGDLVIDVQNWANNPTGYAVGAGQTQQWTETTVVQRGVSTTEAGAASVTMSGTVSASTQWEIGAVSIRAAANAAPSATNLSVAETYTEDTALNLTDIVISDVDSANVTATLTLSNIAAGSLNTGTSGAVTSTYVAGTGVWSASGALADVNTLLAGLTFTPASSFNSSFTIATSVSDGVAAPVTGSKAMTCTAVNNAPSATVATAASDSGGLTLNTAGNDAYLLVDDGSALLGGRTALTLEAQVSLATSSHGNTVLSYAVDGSSSNEVTLFVAPDGRIDFWIGGAVQSTAGTYGWLYDGTPHQLSVTWSSAGGTTVFYIDGTEVGSFGGLGSGYTIAAGGTLLLGQDQDIELGNFDATQSLAGTLHDVRLFDAVRSSAEISAHTLTTLPYDESGLLANWTFNDLSSNSRVMDIVAANNLSVGHAVGVGFTTSNPAMSLAVDENAANGTVVGTVDSTDLERSQRITALLGADATLRYSAETGQFYRVVTSATTWAGAEAAARSGTGSSLLNGVTGQLVTIRSATENSVVLGLIQDYSTDIWLGGSDQLAEGDWRWYEGGSAADAFWSGSASGASGGAYAHWRAGEPSNTGGTEDSLSMYYAVQPGYWNDTTGTAPRGYVIEWNADDVLDSTNPLTYTITSQTVSGAFTVNNDTGVITVADGSLLDRETAASHSITVRTSDGSLTFDQTFSIALRNVYEVPVITSNGGGASAAVSMTEGSTAVTSVTARVDTTGTATYSLAGGADAARFSIDASTGALSFLTSPNYEAPTDANGDNIYAVTVQVADGLGGTDTQALAVTVTNVNEDPVITSNGGGATAALSLAENTSAVTTVTSTDVDGGTPVYSISGGADAARFSIDSATGALSFATAADFENPADANTDNVYQVTVQVSDGSLTDTQALSITVTAANDNAPVITSNGGAATAAVSVAENSTAVTTVTATDADLPAATLVYTISGGADAARFSINGSTGALSFVTAPDYEAPADANADNVYQVTVQVSDGSLATTQALSIAVTAANERAPVITSNGGAATASVSLAENSTTVTTVTATDADLPTATLVYSISGGADAARFSIDGSTGVLGFVTAPDYEAPADANADNVYQVTVQASDGSLTDTQALSITVTAANEGAPVITSNGGAATASVSVAENSTMVTTVTATDADLPASTLAYSITGGADAARFSIDASTGVLGFVTAPDYEAPADANADNVYQVTVQASDGSLTDTQALSITVTAANDNVPVITSNGGAATASVSVAENSTMVTTVTATDADLPASTLAYSITGGADAARFSIDGSTGVLVFVTAPDYEAPADANADNVYQVTVQASDGSLTDTQSLSITVTAANDNAPVITSNGGAATASVSVAENSTMVTTVTATDADLPASTLAYSITGGADAARFSIDASTGVLGFVTAPDHESPSDTDADNLYQVTVQVSDSSLATTQALSIAVTTVNENAPVITSNSGAATASISVAENSTAVTTVTATDADLPVATLVFSIAGGADAARFSIDSSTGALSFVSAPDYENPADANADNVYQVAVQASDGSLATTQALNITITPVNDSTPVITSNGGAATASLGVAENSTAVTTVTAADADLPATTLVFSIDGGADAARFSIDSSTGVLRFATAPDHEVPGDANGDNVYEVIVQASDGTHAHTQALAITVGDVNDNAPVVTPGQRFVLAEISSNGAVLGRVLAADADSAGVLGQWAISGGNFGGAFAIDPATGRISVADAGRLDYETRPTYTLRISVSDGNLVSAEQTVTIVLTDVVEPVAAPSPAPVPGVPDATTPPPVSSVPQPAATTPAPGSAPRPPASGNTGDSAAESSVSMDFSAPAATTRNTPATAGSATSVAARRAAAGELLRSVTGGTDSLDIDLADLDTADSREGSDRAIQTDDTGRGTRMRAAQDGASQPTPNDRDLPLWAAKASAALLGAGFVWWSLRASGLLASLAASTPVWRHLDPIPILGGNDGTGYSTFDTTGTPLWDDEAARDEAASRELLDEARRNLETVIS